MLRDMAAKRRKAMAIVAAILLMLPAAIPKPALAQVCTGPDPNGAVTCTAGAYSGNINYSTNNTPLNLTLEPGVTVTSPGGNAVNLSNSTNPSTFGQLATIAANNANITNVANPTGSNNTGLRIQSAGSATITSSGSIAVNGTQSDDAILAIVEGNNPPNAPANATVTYSGPALSSTGANSTVIQADNRGNGNAVIDAAGNLSGYVGTTSGSGQFFFGLDAVAGDVPGGPDIGDAQVHYRSGTIDVSGFYAIGIFAAAGDGSATVITDPGTTVIVNGADPVLNQTFHTKPGIDAESAGTASAGNKVTMNIASTIEMTGPAAPDPRLTNNGAAIRALSFQDAPISVTYTGPGITTQCGSCIGILPLSGSGAITVKSLGPIITNGAGAIGIRADSGTLINSLFGGAAPGPGGAVTVAASGPISTQGAESHGIWASSTTGAVDVTATNVTTRGEFSAGVVATGGAGAAVSIGGAVMGGWQPDATSVGPVYGMPAAGVILGSANGAATLTNNGSIGALSDLAIKGDPQVVNNGAITGFVQFGGSGNSVVNNGAFNLRDFADTNGDGVRDTVRVAVADLGTGPNNTFSNNGTLALAPTSGATTLVNAGQYLPLGNPNNAIALGGPLQGQLIGAQTFTNSGVIDLQSNPAPGDVLVITGGRQAGVAGPGTYISNGGALKLDTVLNEGGAATLSDTLVVDGTSIGANGATQTFVHNANGPGALTTGDGILVVQVLDPSRSAAGAFALSGEVRGGPFDYRLFQGGLNGSNPQDWFLRSDFTIGPPEPLPPDPLPPDPPSPSPPGVDPIIGPELATYGVVQPIARQLGVTTLGTLHDRIGDTLTYGVGPCAASGANIVRKGYELPPQAANCDTYGWFPSAWGRVFGESVNGRYSAFANPSASGQLIGFQVGLDIWRDSLAPGHSDRAGVYAAYANGNADVTGLVTNPAATGYVLQHTGTVNLNAVSGGAYWTHYGPSGWYLDAVAQGTIYSGSAATQFTSLDTTGYGFIASLEGGYPIALPPLGPGFALEPEAQVLWQTVKFDQSNDAFGNVALNSTFGWVGRLGLRAKWDVVGSNGELWQPYLRANLWQNWGADASTSFGGFPVQLLEASRQLELGGGLTTKVSANLSFYVNGDYLFAVGDTDGGKRNGIRGAAGLRYTW
jgi:outer membrane autotransporter protein